ncbi:MAG TPA: hypothetical protein VGO25_13130 [Rhodanobacteraceae bacterium]|jgi:hypothetical protein|nr:hypothetical protein [Rhodanobacteraceae bacterium]
MRRRARTNLFMLAIVVLLGLAVYAEFRREHALERDPLTKMDPDAIRSLAVTCQGCTARRFEKIDGHWMMREPESKPADDKVIERLTYIVRAPVRYRRPANELDVAKLGLEPPAATLEVDGTVLKFGTTDAIHNDRYVEVGGTIALVPDRFSALLFASPESDAARPPRP